MTVYYSGDQTSAAAERHGEMYQYDNAVATSISAVDTWTEVANFSEGETDNITFASNSLTVVFAGDYELNWYCTALSAVANKVFEFAVSVNDTIVDKCKVRRSFSTTTDAGSMAGSCVLALAANDVVKFEIQNITDDNNITVVNADVMLHEIG